jgi:hypothetical protein
MIQRLPGDLNPASGEPYPSSRTDKFCTGLGIACFAAVLVLHGLGFGGSGGYSLGFLVLVVVIGAVRSALGLEKPGGPAQNASEIAPAQRVDNAHRK